MRVAVSGIHFSGKSSLIKALIKKFPNYKLFEEPYYLMTDEGFEFSEPPSIEEFELLISRSIQIIDKSRKNTIFDRCPLDYLAYALVVSENSSLEEEVDIDYWIG